MTPMPATTPHRTATDLVAAAQRTALANDPANTQLEGALLSAWQRRIGLLERATTLPPDS